MSKIIESLKIQPSRDDILHETIIDTYFAKKTRRKRRAKTIHRSFNKATLVTAASVFVAALAISFIGHILNVQYLNYLKNKIDNAKLVTLFDGGAINRDVIKKFEFRGYAKNTSKVVDKTALLNNSKKYKFGDLSILFKFPVNMSDREISISFKGRLGGEKVYLVLRDADNRSSVLSDVFMTSIWRTETIRLGQIKGDIDLSKVNNLRLECGFEGDPPGERGIMAQAYSTVYIKDIKIAKTPSTGSGFNPEHPSTKAQGSPEPVEGQSQGIKKETKT